MILQGHYYCLGSVISSYLILALSESIETSVKPIFLIIYYVEGSRQGFGWLAEMNVMAPALKKQEVDWEGKKCIQLLIICLFENTRNAFLEIQSKHMRPWRRK